MWRILLSNIFLEFLAKLPLLLSMSVSVQPVYKESPAGMCLTFSGTWKRMVSLSSCHAQQAPYWLIVGPLRFLVGRKLLAAGWNGNESPFASPSCPLRVTWLKVLSRQFWDWWKRKYVCFMEYIRSRRKMGIYGWQRLGRHILIFFHPSIIKT